MSEQFERKDAPERIWVWPGIAVSHAKPYPYGPGTTFHGQGKGDDVEYVRADLVATLTAQRDAARAETWEAAAKIVEQGGSINLCGVEKLVPAESVQEIHNFACRLITKNLRKRVDTLT